MATSGENLIKKSIFLAYAAILDSASISNLFYVILYYIETMQVLFFGLLIVGINSQETYILKNLFAVLKYFQLVPLITERSNIGTDLILLYSVISINSLMLLFDCFLVYLSRS